MKVAFSTSGTTLDAPLEPRFGRAPRFLVYDTVTGAVDIISNGAAQQAAQGAGIQSAQAVARSGAVRLVTGHCGPKAYRALAAAGVRVFVSAEATVKAALEALDAGRLKELQGPDTAGHWS